MAGGISACSMINQTALKCHASVNGGSSEFMSSSFYLKRIPSAWEFHAKNFIFNHQHIQLLGTRDGFRNPSTVVFANPKENDDPEIMGLDLCIDDSMVTYAEDGWNSEYQGREVDFSLLQTDVNMSENAENQGNQDDLLAKLRAVHLHLLAMEQWNAPKLKLCHRKYSVNASNLMHFLALKSLNTQQLSEELSQIGLLNLETIDRQVLASLSAGIQILENLKSSYLNGERNAEVISPDKSLAKQMKTGLTINSIMKSTSSEKDLLLGKLQDKRSIHIMVTVGREGIESETLINDLINAGATIIRINCAHGNQDIWSEIIRRVKRSSQILEKPCRVLMDLAGPKLRTGKLKPGPCVVKITPKKNSSGKVIRPAQVWLSLQGTGPAPPHVSPDAILYVNCQEFLSELEVNHTVRFFDARGKQRILKIISKSSVFSGMGFMAECTKTAYVESGTKLYIKDKRRKSSIGIVVDVPPVEQYVRLRVGDLLIISRDSLDGQNLSTSHVGAHRITCSSGYLFDSVKPGDPIAFDDGKIWGTIKGTDVSEIIVSITHAGPKGTKLGSEKSINIPASNILFEGLTSKDLMDLDFVATHADIVGVSFVRDVCDVTVLRQELAKRNIPNLGIILKIETKGGYEKLPLMLLEAMKSPNPLGVMIARGDLAVECGWENLADIQEEILSICNAAHVPVIWATQVLESLVKSGVPTRAEITDVAVGRSASCVMLNKGKHIVEAVSTLESILNCRPTRRGSGVKPFV